MNIVLLIVSIGVLGVSSYNVAQKITALKERAAMAHKVDKHRITIIVTLYSILEVLFCAFVVIMACGLAGYELVRSQSVLWLMLVVLETLYFFSSWLEKRF